MRPEAGVAGGVPRRLQSANGTPSSHTAVQLAFVVLIWDRIGELVRFHICQRHVMHDIVVKDVGTMIYDHSNFRHRYTRSVTRFV